MKEELSIKANQDLLEKIFKNHKVLGQIYLDQITIIKNLDAQNLIQVDGEQYSITILNRLFRIQILHTENTVVIKKHFVYKNSDANELEHFFYKEFKFFTQDTEIENSVLNIERALKFQALVKSALFKCVDGHKRIGEWFNNASLIEIEKFDCLMIEEGMYSNNKLSEIYLKKKNLSDEIFEIFREVLGVELSNINTLSLSSITQCLQDLSTSAKRVLSRPIHRIVTLFHPEYFTLYDLEDSQYEIKALYQHSVQYENILSFTKLMPQENWHETNIFSKKNYYDPNAKAWLEGVSTPLFTIKKDVNWVFKQHKIVVDWIVESIQHTSVRVAITALSFIDCSKFHPNIILTTLQYFQFASARMFIFSCAFYAGKGNWRQDNNFKDLIFSKNIHGTEENNIITPSILYLEEWLDLLAHKSETDQNVIKNVYANLTRIFYAYMNYLDEVTSDLSYEIKFYIQPEQQKGREFFYLLKFYGIQLDEFRQRFYMRDQHVRETVFDSYVRDYLMYLFSENPIIPKNISWLGIFHKAVQWHHEIQKNEVINKLKEQYINTTWSAFTDTQPIQFNHWQFHELSNIDAIIKESEKFHHCLASSFTSQIVLGEYVAFHMSSHCFEHQLTLGCHLRNGTLLFDQLEYPNNQKAEQLLVSIAKLFIEFINNIRQP